MPTTRRQGRYWLLTIDRFRWIPELPDACSFVKGQPEIGHETYYQHWQILAVFKRKASLRQVKEAFGGNHVHAELSRSSAADDYVWKEETRDGEPFEFGEKPMQRNSSTDWQNVKDLAIRGEIERIPADIFVRYYRTLRAISSDYSAPPCVERSVKVFWGPTGTGKSHRSWSEAGTEAYSKDPRSKFWCGYRGQKHVVLDEFRGGIDISHLLRWLDKYPVRVEVKGSSEALLAEKFWITSNIHPRQWYPELDSSTFAALERRLEIIEINSLLV